MKYENDYCEKNGISTSKLNEAQRTLYYIAENMRIDKSIIEEGYKHFQMAIEALEQEPCDYYDTYNMDAFAELACRRLAELGIVRAKGDEWELIDTQESEVQDEVF